ncbi:carbohydrate-binding protein [Streptomyces sp. NPDC050504]|uniref:carbohydrate-binding protein n=1 Tax=Streptomyces sp. NPDC050504 TaxID=3365618 RepID=UPI0037A9E7E7
MQSTLTGHKLRTALAALAIATAAALGALQSADPATARPAADTTTTPAAPAAVSPDAPHRGTVALARTPGHRTAHDAGRDRAVAALKEARATGHRTAPGVAAPTHNWWGVFPRSGTHDGITATHSVDPAYRVANSQNFTYAPTTKAQNSCIEVVTAYWSAGAEIWAWDWCSDPGGPAKTLPVNADFRAKYTTTTDGLLTYGVQLSKDAGSGNSWSAYLYNQRSAQWELLYRQSGRDRSALDHGWDIFEIYATVNPSTGTGHYCTEARNTVFDSRSIQLRANGSWQPATPADSPWTSQNPNGRDFLCPALKFLKAGANDHYTVRQ